MARWREVGDATISRDGVPLALLSATVTGSLAAWRTKSRAGDIRLSRR
jgi:hypothetical protein